MKYKAGDKVRIKSLDWYNENKSIHGDVWFDNAIFVGGQSLYCGCELTIRLVTDDSYYVIENDYYWTDEMIECKVEEYDLKIGDVVVITNFEKNTDEWSPHYKGEISVIDRIDYPLYYLANDNTTPFTKEQLCVISTISLEKEIQWNLPEGYIFKDDNGNVINAKKIIVEKKKKEYPKTYEECCKILEIPIHGGIALIGNWCMEDGYIVKHLETLRTLSKLLICRDAYWQIAGEEMGLGEPWKPDWTDQETPKYCIAGVEGQIKTAERYIVNTILAFPTAEMRDAFYESFKKEIEICKELL